VRVSLVVELARLAVAIRQIVERSTLTGRLYWRFTAAWDAVSMLRP
jgi:hypothetical protein